MAAALDRFEQAARGRWLGNAARVHYGRCDGCDETRDQDDRPLLVARQPFARRFLCLECFEFGPDQRARDQGATTGLAAVVAGPERTS